MKRLCIKYHLVDCDENSARVCMPGMIYNVEEFKNGQALVGGIWLPDYIFSPSIIKDLTTGGVL